MLQILRCSKSKYLSSFRQTGIFATQRRTLARLLKTGNLRWFDISLSCFILMFAWDEADTSSSVVLFRLALPSSAKFLRPIPLSVTAPKHNKASSYPICPPTTGGSLATPCRLLFFQKKAESRCMRRRS